MRLFKICVRHYSPKDSHESIEGFLLRETEEEVCDFVAKSLAWMDDGQLAEEVKVYDNDFNYIGVESRRARTIRFKGDMFDPNDEVSDLYYGATRYGWKDEGPISNEERCLLRRCGLLLDEQKP